MIAKKFMRFLDEQREMELPMCESGKETSIVCGKGRWTIVPCVSRLDNESNDKTQVRIELNTSRQSRRKQHNKQKGSKSSTCICMTIEALSYWCLLNHRIVILLPVAFLYTFIANNSMSVHTLNG